MTVERIKIDAKRKNEKEKKKKKDCTGNARKKKLSEMPTNRNKTTQFTNFSII